MTPYERPTEELRQVEHGYKEWNRKVIQYLKVQRKWLVQDGEPRLEPYGYWCRENEVKVYPPAVITVEPGKPFPMITGSCGGGGGAGIMGSEWVAKLKEEWRDLPVVSL